VKKRHVTIRKFLTTVWNENSNAHIPTFVENIRKIGNAERGKRKKVILKRQKRYKYIKRRKQERN
jgi:hypothetical protein